MDDLAYRIARMGIKGLALVFIVNKDLPPAKFLPSLFGGPPGQGAISMDAIRQEIRRHTYKEFFIAIVSNMNTEKRELENQLGSVGLPLGLSIEFKNDIIAYG